MVQSGYILGVLFSGSHVVGGGGPGSGEGRWGAIDVFWLEVMGSVVVGWREILQLDKSELVTIQIGDKSGKEKGTQGATQISGLGMMPVARVENRKAGLSVS